MLDLPSSVSPNYDARPDGILPELIIIHAISLPPDRFGGLGVEQLFTNRLDPAGHPYYAQIHMLRVSAHYFIRRTGETLCFVPPELRAWHAGVSSWGGRERCNDFSIGIELEGWLQGMESPAKMKLAVSGCPRNCAESYVKDVGIVAVEGGRWEIYIGGAAGAHIRKGDLLVTVDSAELVRRAIGRSGS